MKNTKEAIRYGIETLGVSPDEMFSLIESSKDYNGEDYNRWLANEIIKIAEKDGVGYSQLLVKKFNIIQDMMSTKELVLKKEWIEYLNKSTNLYSVDFPEVGAPLSDDIDWFNGIDFDKDNSFFLAEEIPAIYDKIINGEQLTILASLSDTGVKKNSELYADATQSGVICKNVGSLFMYRMCRLIESFDLEKKFTLKLFTDVDFLLNKDNESIWKYFLHYFSCTGFVVKSSDLYDGALGTKRFAFINCSPRTGKAIKDSLVLMQGTGFVDGEVQRVGNIRFTRSTKSLEEYLIEKQSGVKKELKKETMARLTNETVLNYEEGVLGYLNLSSSNGAWLSTYPGGTCDKSIAITEQNLDYVIFYYSISFALKMYGINETIHLPLTGDDNYNSLLSNCIPLFLYGVNTRFRGYEGKDSAFDLERSDLVEELLTRGEVYYSFEAKELIDLCKGYSEFLVKNCPDMVKCKCFNDIRIDSDYSEFNSLYVEKIRNLCDYIRGAYKEVA